MKNKSKNMDQIIHSENFLDDINRRVKFQENSIWKKVIPTEQQLYWEIKLQL